MMVSPLTYLKNIIGSVGNFGWFYRKKEWKQLRKYKIENCPLCEDCLTNDIIEPAIEIHHVIPLYKDFDKALDYNNLRSLCRACHKKYTELEQQDQKREWKPLNNKWDI